MTKRKYTKLIHEGQYIAEVEIELIDTDEGWSPYLSLEDAQKLDNVREVLRRGDLKTAAKHARVFSLTPVEIEWFSMESICWLPWDDRGDVKSCCRYCGIVIYYSWQWCNFCLHFITIDLCWNVSAGIWHLQKTPMSE